MKPLPAPLLAVQTEADPYTHAVGEALHDATVTLWRDLYQKVERYEQAHDRMIALTERIDQLLAEIPIDHRARYRRRVARIRTDLEQLR